MQGVLVLRWAENGICKLQHVLPSLLQHGRPDFGYNKIYFLLQFDCCGQVSNV